MNAKLFAATGEVSVLGRRALRTVVLGCLLALLWQGPALAADAPPEAPTSVTVYAGVDGALVRWAEQWDTGLTGYRVQRASTAVDAVWTDLATIPVDAPRSYLDPAAAGETWNYRVLAVTNGGDSPPSLDHAVTIPSPMPAGAISGLAVTSMGSPIPAGGGALFVPPLDSLTVTPLPAGNPGFTMHGVSTADSAQGARDIALTIWTASGDHPLTPGTYSTGNYGQPTVSLCPHGTLVVREASMLADGTPAVLSATFTAPSCHDEVEFRWNAHDPIAHALITDVPSVNFGDVTVGTAVSRTITVINRGSVDQGLGTASIQDYGDSSSARYTIGADTCSGTTLTAGANCTITVAVTPPAVDRGTGRLVLTDTTAAGQRTLFLDSWGIDVPTAPVPTALGTYHLVQLSWPAVVGGQHAPATTYTVLRGDSPDSLTPYADVAAGPFLDREVTVGSTSYYAVIAHNAIGDSPRSVVVSAAPVATGVIVAGHSAATLSAPSQLQVVSPDGDLTATTSTNRSNTTPAISPDGSTLVWSADYVDGGDFDLYIQRRGAAPQHLTFDGASDDSRPAFSPDGRLIAFTRAAAGNPADTSVYVVPVAGGTPTKVPLDGAVADPTWSPNGRLLAVASLTASSGKPVTSIVLTTVDGLIHHSIPGSEADATIRTFHIPSWSPDGKTLSFISAGTNFSHLMTIPAAGGSIRGLSSSSDVVIDQQWAPAGGRIVFTGLHGTSYTTLWSISPNGGTPVALSKPNANVVLTSPAVAEPAAPYVPAAVPAAPSGFMAALAATSAELSWANPADTGWVVVRRSAPDGPAPTTPEDGVAVYTGTGTATVATGLSTGHLYRFAVFAVSPMGDPGPAAVGSVQPATTPTVAPNGTPLATLSKNGPAFTATWGGPLPSGQVYEVQLGTRSAASHWNSVVYQPFYTGTANGGIVPAIPGTTYYLTARIRDAAGHVTAWSATDVVAVPYDDRAFHRSGSWTALSGQSGRFAGTLLRTSKAKAAVNLTADGSRFTLIADRCAACGKVKVYLDGKAVATVDTHAKSTLQRSQVWTSAPFASIGRHTVKVVALGTKGHPKVYVDGLIAAR